MIKETIVIDDTIIVKEVGDRLVFTSDPYLPPLTIKKEDIKELAQRFPPVDDMPF